MLCSPLLPVVVGILRESQLQLRIRVPFKELRRRVTDYVREFRRIPGGNPFERFPLTRCKSYGKTIPVTHVTNLFDEGISIMIRSA